jgi:hypothetical protein
MMDESLGIEKGSLVLTESQVIPLLRELCVDLGFCFDADVAEKFECDPPRTIGTFARAVFIAEGFDAANPSNKKLYDRVRAVIAKAFDAAASK